MNRTVQRYQKIKIDGGYNMKQPGLALWMFVIVLVPVPVWSANWRPLPDTGLAKCYDTTGTEITCPAAGQPLYGQDAQYQEVPPAYEKNNNQTVLDQHTGLVWIESDVDIQRTWQGAVSYCNELVFAGQTDWRLPTKFELESIVDYGRSFPALNKVFTCQHSFYWSATPHLHNPSYAWSVFCPDGADHWVDKTNNYYVRCVRDAE